MVLDEVADGLRKYRKAKEPVSRIRRLEKLAPTKDPRVAVVLGEMLTGGERGVSKPGYRAAGLINRYYSTYPVRGVGWDATVGTADEWWKDNEADLRRRAKQLPQ